jgi:hypothetical protein
MLLVIKMMCGIEISSSAPRVLEGVPASLPGMYCGRTELMTFDEEPCGFSPLFNRTPAFENALVESLAAGNTIVFNRATKKILEDVAITDVVFESLPLRLYYLKRSGVYRQRLMDDLGLLAATAFKTI